MVQIRCSKLLEIDEATRFRKCDGWKRGIVSTYRHPRLANRSNHCPDSDSIGRLLKVGDFTELQLQLQVTE